MNQLNLFISLLLLVMSSQVLAQARTHYFPHSPLRHNTSNQLREIKNNYYQFQFQINELKEIDHHVGKATYQKFVFPQVRLSKRVGHLQMPYKSFIYIGHPHDLDVKVTTGPKYSFDRRHPFPAQPQPCRCEKDLWLKQPFHANDDYYQNDYQENNFLIKTEYLGDYRGFPLSRLIMRPARYLGSQQKLVVYPKINFTIKSKTQQQLFFIKDINELLAIDNGKDYWVLLSKDLRTELFDQWLRHKQSQGFAVNVAYLEDIGNDAAAVKEFLAAQHKQKTIDYLLLIGNETLFPTFYLRTSSYADTPSDLPYVTFGGDEDKIPDVFYGRLPVRNSSDLNNHLQKILDYETRPRDKNQKGIGIASNEGHNPSDVEYIREINRPLLESGVNFFDFFQDDPQATAEEINNTINHGLAWINYIGHGSGKTWPSITGRSYTTEDILELTNQKLHPIIIDVACQNGNFAGENFLGESFVHAVDHRGQPTGALAYYGGSVDITWDPPAIMARGITKRLVSENISTLGAAVMAGQMHLIETYDDKEAALENLVWYHLFGDPSLKLKLGHP